MFFIKDNGFEINEAIRDQQVRLIDEDGAQLGIFSAKDAQKMAFAKNLDLVKIAPQATPPVCRIMDYRKFVYEQGKREKEAKKRQKVVEVKVIKLSIRIEDNDFNTKSSHANKFLEGGDKVKVELRFRGREITRPELGMDLINRFIEACSANGSAPKPAKIEGRSLVVMIEPKPASGNKNAAENKKEI